MLSIGDDRRLMPASRRLGHKTYPHSRAECKNPKLRSATAALDYPQAFYMAANPGYDAVVVGSGFGGSISALRIAEHGRSVLVLERGRRYRPGEFPRDVRDTNALLWRYPRKRRSVGLYDIRFFSSLAAVVASGV